MIRQGSEVSDGARRGVVLRTYTSCGVRVALVRWDDGTRGYRPVHELREVTADAGLFAGEDTT